MKLNPFKKKKCTIYQPVKGEVVPLSKVNDEVFSTGMMGPGFAVIPTDVKIYSPVKGKVTSIFPTKHAITLTSDSGVNILLHIGIDTVDLKGEGFDIQITEGQKLNERDQIAVVDFDMLKSHGKDIDVMVIFPDSSPEMMEKLDFSNTNNIVGEI